jgi:hypothetical protein
MISLLVRRLGRWLARSTGRWTAVRPGEPAVEDNLGAGI